MSTAESRRVSRDVDTTPLWHTTRERPFITSDLGQLVIARDCFNNWISGRIAESGVGMVLKPKHDVLPLNIPVTLVEEYRFVESTG